jgi:hypothetical protein
MRRILFALGLLLVVPLAACADQPSAPGSDGPMPPTPSEGASRVDAYDALVHYLADPAGSQPIYVLADLCFHLMESEMPCPDRLSLEEQQDLRARLRDLGDIVFISNDDPGLSPEDTFQEILLSPIVEQSDGLRVEGGSVCGGLCGSGAVYRLVETESGYVVKGTDDTYGSWIA